MSTKSILAVLVALVAAVCLLPAADAAEFRGDMPDTITIDDNGTADIAFSVYSDSGIDLVITVSEGDSVLATVERHVNAGETADISIPISGLSVGTHNLRVECAGAEFSGSNGFNIQVVVDQSLLSNWVTYLVIAIAVIVVVVFAYLKMRDTPKVKPEMTFEELEAQRKAEMAAKAEKKQKKPLFSSSEKSSSERKRYVAEKKREDKPREEAPKMTFEELDAQKKAEKTAKAEKKSTGLTERERYLAEKRKKEE